MNDPCPLPRSSADATDQSCATVYDPDELATFLVDAPPHAAALIVRLTPAQRLCQALEHVRWCARHAQATTLDQILAEWQHLVTHHQPNVDALIPNASDAVPITALALHIAADPFDAAILLATLSLPERSAAAEEHAHWLALHGLSRATEEVLHDWEALVAYAHNRRSNVVPSNSFKQLKPKTKKRMTKRPRRTRHTRLGAR